LMSDAADGGLAIPLPLVSASKAKVAVMISSLFIVPGSFSEN
jgi:hypothetical protein